MRDDKWGFINLAGDIVIEPIFASCRSFAHGLAVVEDGDSKLYIDTTGKVVIRTGFYRCDSFEGDLAPVMPDIRSRGAFIDRTGTIVLSGRNYLISHLSHGLINCPERESGASSTFEVSSRLLRSTSVLIPSMKVWPL